MGLAVSQVRLLALTNRKADIELQMQINSKRKQMLTRKSTELSQQYYQRLQQSSIQYATSNGYEDVNYDYVMGKQVGKDYSSEFLSQVAKGYGTIPGKSENNMILTNQYGEVILNNTLSTMVKKASLTYAQGTFDYSTVAERTAGVIFNMIKDNKNTDDMFKALADALNNAIQTYDKAPKSGVRAFDGTTVQNGREAVISLLCSMLENGRYENGGTLYINTSYSKKQDFDSAGGANALSNDTSFYASQADAKTNNSAGRVTLKDGCCYNIQNQNNITMCNTIMYSGGYWFEDISARNAEYLSNLINYFGPMISAALQNDSSSKVSYEVGTGEREAVYYVENLNDSGTCYQPGTTPPVAGPVYSEVGSGSKTELGGSASTTVSNGKPQLNEDVRYARVIDRNGNTRYFYYDRTTNTTKEFEDYGTDPTTHITDSTLDTAAEKYFSNFIFRVNSGDDKDYVTSQNTEKLQAGFRSGVYQLCQVSNPSQGIYHKNTTIDYFTHMNYVVEKTDTSKKEEITAWFNSEQAAISEQETYWDAEITNLSTELNAVNTEIDAVKQMKSNAIKSVFDWGGS